MSTEIPVVFTFMKGSIADVIALIDMGDTMVEVPATATRQDGKWVGDNPDPRARSARKEADQRVVEAHRQAAYWKIQIADLRLGLQKAQGNQQRKTRRLVCLLLRKFQEHLREAEAEVLKAAQDREAMYEKYPAKVIFV